MFEWVIPPMLRVAMRMVKAPLPMQDLNLVASCMRLLDALLVPEFRDTPKTITEMNDNVQMVGSHAISSQLPGHVSRTVSVCDVHCMSVCVCHLLLACLKY